ncbi:PPC domain-containing protein [Chloroflexota bacterium]
MPVDQQEITTRAQALSDPRSSDIVHQPTCDELGDVQLAGPTTGIFGAAHSFIATVSPAAAALPIQYKWEATTLPDVLHLVGGPSDTVELSWALMGTQQITVTANNICGVIVSDTHTLTIRPPLPFCHALAGVEISGPATGSVGRATSFTAETSPQTATEPITYAWQVDGGAHITKTGGLSNTAIFSWVVAGPHVVAVWASNECSGPVSHTHTIAIEGRQHTISLPLVLGRHFVDPYEPNDPVALAFGPMVSDRPYVAYIPEGDAEDYYYIEVTSPNPVSVQLNVPDALDLDLYVYDAGFDLVDWSNLSGHGVDEAVDFTPTASGTIYIRVYPFAGRSKDEPYALQAVFDH